MVGVCALAFAFSATAGTLTGRVISVTDGDTITILDDDQRQGKIRRKGIDAPERRQPFGTLGKHFLS
jgi:endonuclease YncB( thermonuclease family)